MTQLSQSIKNQVSQSVMTRANLQQTQRVQLRDVHPIGDLSVFHFISPACGSSPTQVQRMITCTKTCKDYNTYIQRLTLNSETIAQMSLQQVASQKGNIGNSLSGSFRGWCDAEQHASEHWAV